MQLLIQVVHVLYTAFSMIFNFKAWLILLKILINKNCIFYQLFNLIIIIKVNNIRIFWKQINN
jgi:hypothetical protein